MRALKLTNTTLLRDVTQLVLSYVPCGQQYGDAELAGPELQRHRHATDGLWVTAPYHVVLTRQQIRDWAVVDTVAARRWSLPLHGNPIANSPQYRMELLGKLCRSTTRKCESIDFVAVSTGLTRIWDARAVHDSEAEAELLGLRQEGGSHTAWD